MKKKYLYIIIGVLVFVIACLLTYKTSSSIIFNKYEQGITHNFGTLNKNRKSVYNYDFKYVNTIYDTLKIYKVIDGCDCTSSSVKSGEYHKNDTITISTIYNALKYNDKWIIEKNIYVYTNKPLTSYDTILPLKLIGVVK